MVCFKSWDCRESIIGFFQSPTSFISLLKQAFMHPFVSVLSQIVTAFFPLPTICNCQQKIAIFLCNNVLLSFLLFVSCMGSRLFSANTVSTNPAFVSRLHASSLSWWPTCWSTCCGERHYGSFWECQPGHVCNHRQVRVGQAWAEDKSNDWYKSTGFK